jgi:uncharacterized integral membrane protein
MQRGLLTGIILGMGMVIFTLQNEVKVPVKILWMKFNDVPLALILMISILTGVAITMVFSFIDKQRLRNRIKKLQNRIKGIEEETNDGYGRQTANDLISDEGLINEEEPRHKFFDD